VCLAVVVAGAGGVGRVNEAKVAPGRRYGGGSRSVVGDEVEHRVDVLVEGECGGVRGRGHDGSWKRLGSP
jgi:hypothetical protein